MANREVPPFLVKISGGSVVFQNKFMLSYICDEECSIWQRKTDRPFSVSFLTSPSGTGKSTLLFQLFNRIQYQQLKKEPTQTEKILKFMKRLIRNPQMHETEKIKFDFSPNLQDDLPVAVSYIPQDPTVISHWKIRNLLPPDDFMLKRLFTEENSELVFKKRLGEFSGGQQMRLYTCSALNKLIKEKESSKAFFLLLDETFDGLGAYHAGRCIAEIKDQWLSITKKPLHILLITHLNNDEIISSMGEAENITKIIIEFFNETLANKMVKIYNTQ